MVLLETDGRAVGRAVWRATRQFGSSWLPPRPGTPFFCPRRRSSAPSQLVLITNLPLGLMGDTTEGNTPTVINHSLFLLSASHYGSFYKLDGHWMGILGLLVWEGKSLERGGGRVGLDILLTCTYFVERARQIPTGSNPYFTLYHIHSFLSKQLSGCRGRACVVAFLARILSLARSGVRCCWYLVMPVCCCLPDVLPSCL